MSAGDHLPEDGTEHSTKEQEILPEREPRGNAFPADLIRVQPVHATDVEAEASQEAVRIKEDLKKPTCPRCGLTVQDHRLSPGLRPLQGSSLSVHSSNSSSRRSRRSSRSRRRSGGSRSSGGSRGSATPADWCLELLLACLWCQCSVLLLGLLEACSSCLHTLCSCCCHACTRCCSAVQEVPVEELNCHVHCHSVLVESCCEPTECLEFCLELCDICHRS